MRYLSRVHSTWCSGSDALCTLHKRVTRVWEEKVIPEEWHQGIIIPLYKRKGSKSECSNYRRITLLSEPGKVFALIILARIKTTLLSHRHPQQSRFTPGRSTCDRTATLCNTAQRRQDFGHPSFAAFVDLRAAFDSLSRPALWLLLTRLGIPDKIVRLFRVLYDNSVSCVRTGGTHSSWFKIDVMVVEELFYLGSLFHSTTRSINFVTSAAEVLSLVLPCRA